MNEIVCPLSRAVRLWGQNTALITPQRSLTYIELDRLVNQATANLQKIGIEKGERVAIMAPNCLLFPVVVLALLRLGAVACPVNIRHTLKQVQAALNTIGCNRVIIDSLGEHNSLGEFYTINNIDLVKLNEITSGQKEALSNNDEYYIDLNQDATIMFTSGSTAVPRAVLHTYGNHYFSALGSNENIPLTTGDRWLAALPLYHVGGLAILFRTMLSGATMVVAEATGEVISLLQQHQITHVSLVPTQLYHLINNIDNNDLSLHSLKAILVGGAAIPKTLIKQAHENKLPIFTTYGMTETASQVTTTEPSDSSAHLLTSGKPLKYREVNIAEDGEILIRGQTLFKGYIDHARVLPAVDKEGWFHTGDIGRIDSDGYLHVISRKDNMFISGGENIYPEVIEAALREDENIEDAIVVPMPDKIFGHRPVAFIKTKDNQRMNIAMMQKRLRQLPKFMIPIAWYDWPDEMIATALKPDRKLFTKIAERRHR